MAPDERIYCADPWCDGDHLFPGESCANPDAPPVTEPPC